MNSSSKYSYYNIIYWVFIDVQYVWTNKQNLKVFSVFILTQNSRELMSYINSQDNLMQCTFVQLSQLFIYLLSSHPTWKKNIQRKDLSLTTSVPKTNSNYSIFDMFEHYLKKAHLQGISTHQLLANSNCCYRSFKTYYHSTLKQFSANLSPNQRYVKSNVPSY